MENKKETGDFRFTYSAKEQEEVHRIRQKYQPKEENKMEKLRRLDASVTSKATVVSLVLGIMGVLVLGSGMSLIMTNIGSVIGLQGMFAMVIGIVIGIIGIASLACAYPVYTHIVKKERERIAPEILRLTDELMK